MKANKEEPQTTWARLAIILSVIVAGFVILAFAGQSSKEGDNSPHFEPAPTPINRSR